MHASLQNSAQLTHHLSADARQILSLRGKVKKMQEEGYAYNITLNDMVCFAVIRALKSHPGANAHYLGDSIRVFRKVHLGIAVDTDRGLMVPVLRNADDLSLAGLSEQLRTLADAGQALGGPARQPGELRSGDVHTCNKPSTGRDYGCEHHPGKACTDGGWFIRFPSLHGTLTYV